MSRKLLQGYPVGSIPRSGFPLTGTGGILPYSIDFTTESDGALPSPWSGATWAITSGAALVVPTLGSELVSNGNMETGDPPTGWQTSGLISSVSDERTGGSGASSLEFNNNGGGFKISWQDVTVPIGAWLYLSSWCRRTQSNRGVAVYMMDSSFTSLLNVDITTTAWNNILASLRAPTTTMRPVFRGDGNTDSIGHGDDVSLKVITPATMLSTIHGVASTNKTIGANWTFPNYTQGGVIAALDSPSAPLYFVIGYYDRATGKAVLEKCVNGTYTTLINTTAGYSANAEVKVIKTGTTYQLWYNNVQIGTDQTVSDVGNGEYFGLFGTGGGGSVSRFFCL